MNAKAAKRDRKERTERPERHEPLRFIPEFAEGTQRFS